MPAVSVIVPVYNTEKTIARCLDSIVGQSLRDIEILVIDDGSTDGSAEIADAYAKRDSRVKIFGKKNGGLGSARNLGIDKASGDYLAFIDSDDFVESNMLETMFSSLCESGFGLVSCSAVVDEVDRDGNCRPVGFLKLPFDGVVEGHDAFSLLANQISPVLNSVCFKLVKRELFTQGNVRFPEDHRFVEDMPVSSFLLLNSAEVLFLDKPFYHYVRSDSVLSSSYSMKKSEDVYTDMMEICRIADEAGYSETLDNFKLSMLFSSIKQIVWSGEPDYSVLSERAKEGKCLCPAFAGKGIPFIQKMKIASVSFGVAEMSCRAIWLLRGIPFFKYMA